VRSTRSRSKTPVASVRRKTKDGSARKIQRAFRHWQEHGPIGKQRATLDRLWRAPCDKPEAAMPRQGQDQIDEIRALLGLGRADLERSDAAVVSAAMAELGLKDSRYISSAAVACDFWVDGDRLLVLQCGARTPRTSARSA
jgi:hypothetical protein